MAQGNQNSNQGGAANSGNNGGGSAPTGDQDNKPQGQGNQNSNQGGADSQPPTPPAAPPSEPGGTSDEDKTPTTSVAQAAPKQAKQDEQIAKNRAAEIDAREDLSADDKTILKMYDRGEHPFKIAQTVYTFANSDSVGRVMLVIRREHADDYDELEDVNSTKGYTGVGAQATTGV